MEIEVFVHGALCMAYSGRCLLSGYFNRRDPNQGACTNACRWQYKTTSAQSDEAGQLNPVVLEEPMRPGEFMPLEEDEHGSYIMNSKDLRAVEYVQALTDIGVHSLKIEGRTKTPYYGARTAQVYRQAIDDAASGRPFNPALLNALDGMANRGFTSGFLQRHQPQDLQNYQTSHSNGTQQFAGVFNGEQITDTTGNHWAIVDVRNKFSCGDQVEMMTPAGNISWVVTQLQDSNGHPLQTAKGSGHQVRLSVPADLPLQHAMLLRCDSPSPPLKQGK